eukprot:1430687-Rhodomonas_salina.1
MLLYQKELGGEPQDGVYEMIMGKGHSIEVTPADKTQHLHLCARSNVDAICKMCMCPVIRGPVLV